MRNAARRAIKLLEVYRHRLESGATKLPEVLSGAESMKKHSLSKLVGAAFVQNVVWDGWVHAVYAVKSKRYFFRITRV